MMRWTLWIAILLLMGGLALWPTATAPDPQTSHRVPPPARSIELDSTATIKTTPGPEGHPDVWIRKGGTWMNLTRFDRPQHIYDYQASPDGRFAFVWHMSYTPRKISVYDLETGNRISRFSPGWAGSLHWTPHNTILHKGGFGTGKDMDLYDLEGNELIGFHERDSVEFAVSPTLDYVATIPIYASDTGFVNVYETRKGTLLTQYVRPVVIESHADVDWLDRGCVEVTYYKYSAESTPLHFRVEVDDKFIP